MMVGRRFGAIAFLILATVIVATCGIALAERGEDHYLIGKKYLSGTGVNQDKAEAARWFRKAADQGHPDAQVNLGLMYERGQGVPQSDTEAVRWFRKAAERGDTVAPYNLGVMYAHGWGVPQSDAEAVKWYRQAAEQGHEKAQSELRKRGLTWTVRAPEKGAPRAESPPPSSPAAGKQRAPTPKIPDDLGDLD